MGDLCDGFPLDDSRIGATAADDCRKCCDGKVVLARASQFLPWDRQSSNRHSNSRRHVRWIGPKLASLSASRAWWQSHFSWPLDHNRLPKITLATSAFSDASLRGPSVHHAHQRPSNANNDAQDNQPKSDRDTTTTPTPFDQRWRQDRRR
jgi:hypothetical protein